MSARHPDYSKHGFTGNPDIYGLGIRIGYYTQAVSLWVANLYAPHEAPFLHTVTLLFLLSILAGVSMLASQSRSTYAVEPFLLVQIAYNTAYMGVIGRPAPSGLLIWERRYRQRLLSDGVVLGLHIFDTWYWWHGLWTLKPTDGPEGNPVYFPYIGRIDLGQSWVKWLGRSWNAWGISWILLDIFIFMSYCIQQRRLNRAVTPKTLTDDAAKWLEAAQIDDPNDYTDQLEKPGMVWSATDDYPTTRERQRQMSKPRDLSEGSSQSEVMAEVDIVLPFKPIAEGLGKITENKAGGAVEVDDEFETPKQTGHFYRDNRPTSVFDQPVHTPSNPSIGLVARLPLISLANSAHTKLKHHRRNCSRYLGDCNRRGYEPVFQNLFTADNFLTEVSPSVKRPHRVWLAARDWLLLPITLPYLLLTNKFRPSVLLAVLSYRRHKQFSPDQLSLPKVLRQTVHHPLYPTICAFDLALIARIRLTLTPPADKSRRTAVVQSFLMFAACAVLVISTELTIQWNYIADVQSIDNVGQCIPFAVGVGGLVKVVYAAVFERKTQEMNCFGRCAAEQRHKDWKEAADAYQLAKKCIENRKEKMPLEDIDREMDENIRRYEFA